MPKPQQTRHDSIYAEHNQPTGREITDLSFGKVSISGASDDFPGPNGTGVAIDNVVFQEKQEGN